MTQPTLSFYFDQAASTSTAKSAGEKRPAETMEIAPGTSKHRKSGVDQSWFRGSRHPTEIVVSQECGVVSVVRVTADLSVYHFERQHG